MIPINEDFALDWDSNCFSILKKETVKYVGKPGPNRKLLPESEWTFRYTPVGFYGKLSHALAGFTKNAIVVSDAASFEALVKVMVEVKDVIAKFESIYPSHMKPKSASADAA